MKQFERETISWCKAVGDDGVLMRFAYDVIEGNLPIQTYKYGLEKFKNGCVARNKNVRHKYILDNGDFINGLYVLTAKVFNKSVKNSLLQEGWVIGREYKDILVAYKGFLIDFDVWKKTAISVAKHLTEIGDDFFKEKEK